MRTYAYNLGMAQADDVIFRQSWLWMAFGAGVCLLFPAAGVAFLLVPHGPPGWFAWVWIVGGMAIALVLLRRVRLSLSADNWLLRYNSRGLLIKIGPTWGRDTADAFVAELSHDEIAWVRAYRHTTITREAGKRTSRPCGYLEIKLRAPPSEELEALRTCLATAGKPKTWHGWTAVSGVPVRVTDDGMVRLQWYGPDSWVAPSLKRAVGVLGQEFALQDEVSETDDFTVPTADQQKMERQIVEFVAQGQMIAATKLARLRYGYSLAEAHRFVEDLRGADRAGSENKVQD
jgi:hypothetical protein